MLGLFIVLFIIMFILVYDEMKIFTFFVEFVTGLPERLIKALKKAAVPEDKNLAVPVKTEIGIRRYDRRYEEILNDPDFRWTVEYFRPHWRWMTLAGGTDPWLYPRISYDSDGTICLKKQGYDLWTGNWKEYKNGTVRAEREKALERFSVDLFGKHAGKLKISTEYIADHLIEFEDSSAYTSDFTLTFSFPGNFKTGEEKYQFRCELENTKIFDIQE